MTQWVKGLPHETGGLSADWVGVAAAINPRAPEAEPSWNPQGKLAN